MENNPSDLDDVVVSLHYLARFVEQNLGVGNLSDDIRECADKLCRVIQNYQTEDN